MFLLKWLVNSLSKPLTMSLFFIAFSMGNASTFAASDIQTIQTAVTAFQTIGTLRRETPINGDAIANPGFLQTARGKRIGWMINAALLIN